jgi:protein phosphatase
MGDLLAGDQITGARAYQEDAYRIVAFRKGNGDACDALMVITDGMGGHRGGAKASGVAVEAFVERFARLGGSMADRLRGALDASNTAVGQVASEEPRFAGMGCTLIACAVSSDECDWVSVGDALLWSLDRDGLQRLNADHSMRPLLEKLVAIGRMTPEELEKDGSVGHLRSAVMGEELTLIDAGNGPRRLRPGDRVILASDGLLTLSTSEIADACDASATASEAVATLLQRVEQARLRGQDNATVIVYRHVRSRSIRMRIQEFEAPTRRLRPSDRRE